MNYTVTRIILLSIFGALIFARPHIAVVTKVRGKVTKLVPGSLTASKIKRGDKLYVDTSIVTGSRSFVKILFLDQSKVTIGPKSKLIINHFERKSGSVVSLLKGKLRVKVERNAKKSQKFFVKTRTAALGVRGTEFQALYNPENKVTNLLTFKGKVAFVKANHDFRLPEKTVQVIERESGGKVKYKSVKLENNLNAAQRLDQVLLQAKDSVMVLAGQYAGTVESLEKASKPVKINPKQLGILYSNREFEQIAEADIGSAKKVQNIKEYVHLAQAEQKVPLEGFYDEKTGNHAPKSGGFIDTETGLYIAPGADAPFDETAKIYSPQNAGLLDAATGTYVAPKGLVLDANKGFILKGRYKNEKRQQLLVKNLTSLNSSLGSAILSKSMKKKEKLRYSSRELFTKDIVSFSLSPQSGEVVMKGETSKQSETHRFEGISALQFSWLMAGSGTYRPTFSFKLKSTDYEEEQRYEQEGDRLFGMSVGLNRYLSARWSLVTSISIEEENIPDGFDFDTGRIILEKVSLTKIGVGIDGDFYSGKKSSLGLRALVVTNLYKKDAEISVKNGFGYQVALKYGYWLKKNHLLEVALFKDFHTATVNGTLETSTYEASTGGLKLSYLNVF